MGQSAAAVKMRHAMVFILQSSFDGRTFAGGGRPLSVFLSYARDDEAKAKALAGLLEQAGHEVWWDRHIRGGTEYSAEIERALEKAQAIVVLWSKASAGSQWVRDEAAEGRDSGRLVPVSLDASRPPIGFRQIHTVDLSDWSGSGDPRELGPLLEAIAAKSPSSQAFQAPNRQPSASIIPTRQLRLAAIAALVALLALGGLLAWQWSSERAAERPTLAVLPFVDLSPGRDKAFLTEGVAEEILSSLARDPGIRVIGRSTSGRFTATAEDFQKLKRQLGVTHVLEGSARTADNELRMSVRLIETSNGTQLWGQEYHRQLSNIFAVQDDIGRAVAEQLRGSLSKVATRDRHQVTRPEVYALYLDARTQMRERREASLEEALTLVRQVVAADPAYAPGQALMAEVIALLSNDNYGKLPPDRVLKLARPHAAEAIRLAPNAPEGHAAMGLLLLERPRAAVGPLRRAVALDPARGEIRLWLASANSQLGNQDEALRHYRALTAMEPLWQPAIALQAVSLAAAGDYRQAEDLVTQFERRGGRPGEAIVLRGRIAETRGELANAVRFAEQARRLEPSMSYTNMFLGWYFHMLGLGEQARQAGSGEPLFTRLALAGRDEALATEARRMGAAALMQPDADVAIAALARRRDWQTLQSLYGHWRRAADEGCNESLGGGVIAARRRAAMVPFQFASALIASGRQGEASKLLNCVRRSLDRQSSGAIRHYSLSLGAAHFARAQLLALGAKRAEALQSLDRAVDAGWRGWHSTRLADFPALDSLRATPDFRRIQAKLDMLIARDRVRVAGAETAQAA
jgi:adenylate cyclase